MLKCSFCNCESVYLARYSGLHYCRLHFTASVERRVKRAVREQRIFERGQRVAVAVSGGKDSMTALHLLSSLASARRGTEIIAVTVDEGIRGYRDRSMEVVSDFCSIRGIRWVTRSYSEFAGFTMDMLSSARRERTTCAYCGVFRRTIMNALAREAGADVIATGLNLDDTAQSVLMNMSRGDTDRIAMMGPHESSVQGLVPRVQPLRHIPENEVLLYAMVSGIPFLQSSCPYAEEASRNMFREVLLRIEDEMPGARHAMVRAASRAAFPRRGGKAGSCASCGDATSGERCRACELREEAASLVGRGD